MAGPPKSRMLASHDEPRRSGGRPLANTGDVRSSLEGGA
ncbi:MAG: hypothetical protein AVDCRST_MAG08-2317 [uncultured Acetobacteraceae bacterium]|uniref:Uncharacterized protein n=1 Tax=uncultured Acetobacteraceae bacterium TaxID=169975 RepID=A0A6J4INC4_9PROT|nr:MAG: hypothetical protein AVDCRST_MAG08-2317 [uncultured Acetobacteraceae bacterium]